MKNLGFPSLFLAITTGDSQGLSAGLVILALSMHFISWSTTRSYAGGI